MKRLFAEAPIYERVQTQVRGKSRQEERGQNSIGKVIVHQYTRRGQNRSTPCSREAQTVVVPHARRKQNSKHNPPNAAHSQAHTNRHYCSTDIDTMYSLRGTPSM